MLALSSFWLGALHALEPGHGKTVVGAYLIGSRGRPADAVLLGIVVTLTHTGIVILLAVLSAVAAAYFVPDTVHGVLELVSALLIVAVGGWMIWIRYKQARHPLGLRTDPHSHAAPGDAGREHGGHHHQPHLPDVIRGQRPSLGQLLTLGISGGIVPCPAALAVLLAAIAYGSYLRGISLVIIFSLGMACTLVAIGLAMLRMAHVASKYVAESRWTRIVPVVSAVLITLVGVGLTVKALLDITFG